jgi:hypothetical protein
MISPVKGKARDPVGAAERVLGADVSIQMISPVKGKNPGF